MKGTKNSLNLHALLTPNLKIAIGQTSLQYQTPNTTDDEATVVTDNRSRETSRVASEGGQPVIKIEEIRMA